MNIHQIKEDFHPDDWPEFQHEDQFDEIELFFIGLNEARLFKKYGIGFGGKGESAFSKREWKFILNCKKIGIVRGSNMKDYIIYVDGNLVGKIKAANLNAAEKKAKSKYPKNKDSILVEPTEF